MSVWRCPLSSTDKPGVSLAGQSWHEISVPVSGIAYIWHVFKVDLRQHLRESLSKSQENGLQLCMTLILENSIGGKKITVFEDQLDLGLWVPTPVQRGALSISVIGDPFFSWDWSKAWGGGWAYRMPAKKKKKKVSNFKSALLTASIIPIQNLSVSWHLVALFPHHMECGAALMKPRLSVLRVPLLRLPRTHVILRSLCLNTTPRRKTR